LINLASGGFHIIRSIVTRDACGNRLLFNRSFR